MVHVFLKKKLWNLCLLLHLCLHAAVFSLTEPFLFLNVMTDAPSLINELFQWEYVYYMPHPFLTLSQEKGSGVLILENRDCQGPCARKEFSNILCVNHPWTFWQMCFILVSFSWNEAFQLRLIPKLGLMITQSICL